MRRLPLYETPPQSAAGLAKPQAASANCTRCERGKLAQAVCIREDSSGPGGLYVVGGEPTKREDLAAGPSIELLGRPFVGPDGYFLRRSIAKVWSGNVTFDYAMRCYRQPVKSDEKYDPAEVEACRGHLAEALARIKPDRILVLGPAAALGVLGRAVQPLSVRKGYGWHRREDGVWVPVFFLLEPKDVVENFLYRRAFQEDLAYALTTNPVPDFGAVTWLVETAADAWDATLDLCEETGTIWFDVETSGRVHSSEHRIECLTLWGDSAKHGWTFDRRALSNSEIARLLRSLFTFPDLKFGGHNTKYDVQSVLSEPLLGKFPIEALAEDTRLMRKLHEADVDGSLGVCAELVGQGGHKGEAHDEIDTIKHELQMLAGELLKPATTKTGKPRKVFEPKHPNVIREFALMSPNERNALLANIAYKRAEAMEYAYRFLDPTIRARYNARDVYTTKLLGRWAHERLGAPQRRVYNEITLPATRALALMERNGFPVDTGALSVFSKYLDAEADKALATMRACAGPDFNPASRPQLLATLEAQGITSKKKTAGGGMSTDDQALEPYKKRPFVAALFRWREVTKLNSTYAQGWLNAVHADGKLRPSYLSDGTESGRPSCTRPNLSNAPRAKDTPEGKMLRDCAKAPPGHWILEGDLKQAEIFKAAELSDDPAMQAILLSGVDFHQATADMIGRSRQESKTTVFAVLYELPEMLGRLVAKRLSDASKGIKVSYEEGQKIADAMFGKFKRLRAWMPECLAQARKDGGAWTYWKGEKARFRPLWNLGAAGDEKKYQRENAERSTWNTPVQGSAADHVTAALWEFVSWARTVQGVYPCLTIYDSIVVIVRDDMLAIAARKLKECMTAVPMGKVPTGADQKIGRSWGSMEDYDPDKPVAV